MKILWMFLTLVGLNITLNASSHGPLFIQESGQCHKIQFDHIVTTTKPDEHGYKDCNHLYIIDPLSKMSILQESSIPLNDFTADSVSPPQRSNKDLYFESNLSLCDTFDYNTSIYSTTEDVRHINNYIVSIESTKYFYGAGAAHGHTTIHHYVYDREYGMRLNWKDLFKDEMIEKYILNRVINELASKEYLEFTRTRGKNSFVFALHNIDHDTVLMNFKKNGNFSILKEGLLVQYNQYEIGPYSLGAPSLIIPPDILKEYMYEEVYKMCFSNKNNVKLLKKCDFNAQLNSF